MSESIREVRSITYYTISFSADDLGYIDEAPRKPFWSRERAIAAAKAFLTEHGSKWLYWPRNSNRGFDREACDERGGYLYPASGNELQQRAVPSTLRIETAENDGVIQASAEIEWREVHAYDKRIETIVDGHTYERTERVVEVVHDWQPLCKRRYGLMGDDISRARATTQAYVSEQTIEFADGAVDAAG